MQLETKRLILRPATPEDTAEIFEYRSDAETNRYQGWIPETLSDVDAFIGRLSNHINEPETWFQFVIVQKPSGKIIGDLGIHFIGETGSQVELGCTLRKQSQKQGFAREALIRIIDFAFIELNKLRVMASIDPENTNSIRLVEKLGFRKESHRIASSKINGKWADDLIYALDVRDWQQFTSDPL